MIQNIPSQDTFQKAVDPPLGKLEPEKNRVGCYIKAGKDQADCGTREERGESEGTIDKRERKMREFRHKILNFHLNLTLMLNFASDLVHGKEEMMKIENVRAVDTEHT